MTKMKTNHTVPKKALSVLLSVVMVLGYVGLFSTLFALKAYAASYSVTAYWNCVNTKSTYDGNRMILYNADKSLSQSIPSDGSTPATNTTGDHNETVTLSWVPAYVEYRCQGNIADVSEWYITGLSVNGVSIWTGKVGCKKQNVTTNTAKTTLDIANGSCSSWSNSGSNFSTTTSTHATSSTLQPKNTTINVSVNNSSVACSGTATFSSSVVDQYGQSLGASATMTYSSLPSGVTRSGNTVTFPNTAFSNGSVTMTASYSGLTSKTATVTFTAHTFGTPSYTWSGTASCTASRTCSKCSYVHSQSATITSSVKTAATCTVKGTTRYTATFAHSAFSTQTKDVQDIAVLGHSYTGDYVNQSSGKHYKKCVRFSSCGTYGIGTTQNATENCSGGTANCVDKAVCTKCSTAYGSVDAGNHKSTENRAAVSPTCTAVGYTAGIFCTACNQWVSGHTAVSATGHSEHSA